MVDFVLDCAKTNNNVDIGIRSSVQIKNEGFYKKELSEETRQLFNMLVISYYNYGSTTDKYFIIKNIFLKTDNEGNYEQGGALLYAIIQGIKMGMILLKTQDKANNYIMQVSTMLEPTQKYFHNTEGFKEELFNILMTLEICSDGEKFYWKVEEDEKNSQLRFKGNGDYPLIIFHKEPLFTSNSRVASLIEKHVIELILKKILDNNLSFTSDILVQTVFKSFEINITPQSYNLNIVLLLNYAFMNINIIDNIINSIHRKCNYSPYNKITRINGTPVKKMNFASINYMKNFLHNVVKYRPP